VSHRRVALPRARTPPAEDGPLVERDILAYFSRLADHDAHAVVDEATRSDLRPGMDLDARQESGEVGDEARHEAKPQPPEGVGDPVELKGVKSRVTQEHLEEVAGRRISFEHR